MVAHNGRFPLGLILREFLSQLNKQMTFPLCVKWEMTAGLCGKFYQYNDIYESTVEQLL